MNLIGEVDVRKSTAYFEKDRKRIFSAIESHESVKMDDLNMLVMSELRKWLIAEGLTVLMKHWPQKSKIRLPDSIFVERDLNRSEKNVSTSSSPSPPSIMSFNSSDENLSSIEILKLMNQCGRLLLEFTKYDVALDLLKCAVSFAEHANDVDEYDDDMQNVSNFLCWLLIDRSRYDEAMSLLKKYYERNKLKLGLNHDITLQCASHLLRCYHETGKLKSALSIGEEALLECKDHSNVRVLELQFCVGKLLIDMNRLSQAKSLLEETMRGCEKHCVKRHWIKMTSEAFLGRILMEEGDYDRAEESLRNALRDARISRGEDHKITLYAKSFLCRLLIKMDSCTTKEYISEINSILPRCLADCSRLLGRQHWLTLYCKDTQVAMCCSSSSSSS